MNSEYDDFDDDDIVDHLDDDDFGGADFGDDDDQVMGLVGDDDDQVMGLMGDDDYHQVMGLVGDQSAYYPFMTSGSGPARQARGSILSCPKTISPLNV